MFLLADGDVSFVLGSMVVRNAAGLLARFTELHAAFSLSRP